MKTKTKRRPAERFDINDQEQMLKFASMIGAGMANASLAGGVPITKEANLGALPSASIYGRKSIFDPCAPGDVFGLQVAAHGFMQWLGFRPNKYFQRHVNFITWWGPEGITDNTHGTGATSPCQDPPKWSYGECGYYLCHESWYSRGGEPVDPHTASQERCETSPRYRLNGVPIVDEVEWQMNGSMNVLQQSILRDLIHGNHQNAYELDGLEQLVRTGYVNVKRAGVTCPRVDSILVNWGHDNFNGTLNGLGNFFDYLDEVVTEIEWRASAIGTIAPVDMILLMPRFMATCVLDAFACYTTCGVTTANDITDQALRAQQRAARRDLNAGPLYDGKYAVGYIALKSGRQLPIIVDDALDIEFNGTNYTSDIYLLTRRVGNIDVLYGEFLDLRIAENAFKKYDPNVRMRTDAIGRFMFKGKEQNFCHELIMGTSPEIYIAAPWAQVRIYDIGCSRERQPLVGDPFQADYLPGGRPLYPADSPFYTEEEGYC